MKWLFKVGALACIVVIAVGVWAHLNAKLPPPLQERTDDLQDLAESWWERAKSWWSEEPDPSTADGSAGDEVPITALTTTPTPNILSDSGQEPELSSSAFSEAEAMLEDRINEFRANRGLPVLVHASSLVDVARRHSEDMANRGFFDHVNPDGLEPQDRVELADLSDFSCGENLFQLTDATQRSAKYIASEAFTGWLNSPGHYQNMVAPNYDTGAVGVFVTSRFRLGDLIPRRYDIYVTHLLCKDISEYNRLSRQYDAANVLYDQLEVEYETLSREYEAVEEQYVDNAVPYAQVEVAYQRLELAIFRLNAQTDEINRLVEQLNAAAAR